MTRHFQVAVKLLEHGSLLDDETKQRLRACPKIMAGAAAELYWVHNPKEMWDVCGDITGCAPPFPAFYLEFAMPEISVSEQFGTVPHPMAGMAVGVLVAATTNHADRHSFSEDAATPVCHFYQFTYYLSAPGKLLDTRCMGQHEVAMTADWSVCRSKSNGGPLRSWVNGAGIPREKMANVESTAVTMMLNPTLLALQLLNCKNTSLVLDTPAAARRRRVFPGAPTVRYHVLVVAPLRRRRSNNAADTNGHPKALHVCRGHFVDYRSGAGLFGKYHGLFYVGPHLRGNSARGVVIKDYQLKEGTP